MKKASIKVETKTYQKGGKTAKKERMLKRVKRVRDNTAQGEDGREENDNFDIIAARAKKRFGDDPDFMEKLQYVINEKSSVKSADKRFAGTQEAHQALIDRSQRMPSKEDYAKNGVLENAANKAFGKSRDDEGNKESGNADEMQEMAAKLTGNKEYVEPKLGNNTNDNYGTNSAMGSSSSANDNNRYYAEGTPSNILLMANKATNSPEEQARVDAMNGVKSNQGMQGVPRFGGSFDEAFVKARDYYGSGTPGQFVWEGTGQLYGNAMNTQDELGKYNKKFGTAFNPQTQQVVNEHDEVGAMQEYQERENERLKSASTNNAEQKKMGGRIRAYAAGGKLGNLAPKYVEKWYAKNADKHKNANSFTLDGIKYSIA